VNHYFEEQITFLDRQDYCLNISLDNEYNLNFYMQTSPL
jgi:hypothetical protein